MNESAVNYDLSVITRGESWALSEPATAQFTLANEYLSYLSDRRYSPRIVRAHAFDLLHFCRWLMECDVAFAAVSTQTLLRFLSECRDAVLPGQHGGNVVQLRSGRSAGHVPAKLSPNEWCTSL